MTLNIADEGFVLEKFQVPYYDCFVAVRHASMHSLLKKVHGGLIFLA